MIYLSYHGWVILGIIHQASNFFACYCFLLAVLLLVAIVKYIIFSSHSCGLASWARLAVFDGLLCSYSTICSACVVGVWDSTAFIFDACTSK